MAAQLNLVDPQEITQDELARNYLQALGRKPRITHLPLFALFSSAAGLKLALELIGKQSPVTTYRLKSAIGNRRFDCSAAKRAFGWEPCVGIQNGLQQIHYGPARQHFRAALRIRNPGTWHWPDPYGIGGCGLIVRERGR